MDGEELSRITREEIQKRVREGIKTLLEQILEEEMNEHLKAGYRERTPERRGERNGHYTRGLITPVGKIEQLRVPRDRQGEFLTEVFERYKRVTGELEDAVLEMFLQGVSTRKIQEVTQLLSKVKIGKDAVSRMTARLREEVEKWRSSPIRKRYVYLFADATYLKQNWGGRVVDVALLVVVGVDDEGHREVLAVELAAGETREAWRNIFRKLKERGLSGVRLVVSDDHEAIKHALRVELAGARWQRCSVHFERNVLSYVPRPHVKAVAQDMRDIFQVSKRDAAEKLAAAFVEKYRVKFPEAVRAFERGISDALTYLDFPKSHHRHIKSTKMLERLFRELKRRTRVIGVFPNEESTLCLSTVVLLRVSQAWAVHRYLDMSDFFEAAA